MPQNPYVFIHSGSAVSWKHRGVDMAAVLGGTTRPCTNTTYRGNQALTPGFQVYVHVKKRCPMAFRFEGVHILDLVDGFEPLHARFDAFIFGSHAQQRQMCAKSSKLCAVISHQFNLPGGPNGYRIREISERPWVDRPLRVGWSGSGDAVFMPEVSAQIAPHKLITESRFPSPWVDPVAADCNASALNETILRQTVSGDQSALRCTPHNSIS